jgi:hypothetical protein
MHFLGFAALSWENSWRNPIVHVTQREVIWTLSRLFPAKRRTDNRKGRGSDSRRKAIVSKKLRDERVFESLQTSFKDSFKAIVESLRGDIQAAISTHLSVITNTMNIIRNENVALESERDPEFRSRVERGVRSAMDEIRRIQDVIGA